MNQREVAISVCKCSQNGKLFGIRFEKSNPGWEMVWAFPIGEQAAAAEKFDQTQIIGPFYTGKEYPGCPYCGNRNFWCCGSDGRMNCYDGYSKTATCQWCGRFGELGGSVESIEITSDI